MLVLARVQSGVGTDGLGNGDATSFGVPILFRVIPHREIRARRVTSLQNKFDMKIILLLTCLTTLLLTNGCIVAEGGRHGHARYERHEEVIVGPPVVVVRPPEIVVRPPAIIVR